MLAALVFPVGARTNMASLERATAMGAQQSAKTRCASGQTGIDHLDREQRDQSNERVDIDAVRLSVGVDDQILEEPGRGVPQGNADIDMAADRVGDRQERVKVWMAMLS